MIITSLHPLNPQPCAEQGDDEGGGAAHDGRLLRDRAHQPGPIPCGIFVTLLCTELRVQRIAIVISPIRLLWPFSNN